MIVLGLTGSIGMGKSTVAQMFAEEGIAVFDADAEVHRLQGPEGPIVGAIEAAFPGTTGPQGVDRAELRARVFDHPEEFARLEAIVHPAVAGARESFLARHRDDALVVLDIPLLFETGGTVRVDQVVVVSAPPEIQRERVLARPTMSPERFEAILARQIPDADKRARADHVITTDGPIEATRAQVRALIACLARRAGG
ncbi:dephospho-CoA kinase [Sphingomonas sp. MMS12-HWE2-04]|uniref:dephospho-CoA kinase n=1 Tax=Sphingomonas sp. MMS12-HWE2-04 TaxID=3234199 RepID=UPI00384C4A19